MINQIASYTEQLWRQGRKIKQSQSGWLSGNAVCCINNGHSADTRGRGGLIVSSDGKVSWHCFNCQFKTGYIPGYPLSFKYRKFLKWLGSDQNEIQRLVVEALRVKELILPQDIKPLEEEITFEPRTLPDQAQNLLALAEFYLISNKEFPKELINVVNYVADRQINMKNYDFYWTPQVEHKLSHRVIIPFNYKGKIVGYTARAIVDGIMPKYHSDHPASFVFNLDRQQYDNKFVLVCEGAFDAMSVDGLAVLSNDISEQQAELIESLGRKVIIVPDFDKHVNKQGKLVWPGSKLVDKAIEYNWSVSFPVWKDKCKDVNHAVQSFGKLFTIKTILDSTESNSLKIQLFKKRYASKN